MVVGASDEITILCAGHPLPLLRTACGRHRGHRCDRARRRTPPLYRRRHRHARRRRRYGEDRAIDALSARDAEQVVAVTQEILAAIDAFAVGAQIDDIAMIALRRTGVPVSGRVRTRDSCD